MKSLRAAACAIQNPPPFSSLRGFANALKLPAPVSLSHLYDALRAPVSFHANIVTPSGTALGGTVDLTVSHDGRTVFDVHMHDSGFDPYTFRVRCALRAPSGLIFLYQTSGHTDGTGSSLLGHVNRNFDHHEDTINTSIQAYWTDFRFATMAVSKSYDDGGLLHTIEDIAKDLLGFLIADVTLGAGLALVVCISADLSNALNGSFIGPGGIVGVVVAGGIAWVWGPSAIIASIVIGVAAGALVDAEIKHRSLTQAEYDFAEIVFLGTLPPRERIYVTNLSHDSGRKYTWPEVDGSIILNLGDEAFADPMHFTSGGYPTRGQVLIHEMSHAWQIRTKSFIPGLLCNYLTTTHTYTVGSPGKAWSDYGLEQQATIVDTWFGTYAVNWTDVANAAALLTGVKAQNDPFFPYIQNNIRLGQN